MYVSELLLLRQHEGRRRVDLPHDSAAVVTLWTFGREKATLSFATCGASLLSAYTQICSLDGPIWPRTTVTRYSVCKAFSMRRNQGTRALKTSCSLALRILCFTCALRKTALSCACRYASGSLADTALTHWQQRSPRCYRRAACRTVFSGAATTGRLGIWCAMPHRRKRERMVATAAVELTQTAAALVAILDGSKRSGAERNSIRCTWFERVHRVQYSLLDT